MSELQIILIIIGSFVLLFLITYYLYLKILNRKSKNRIFKNLFSLDQLIGFIVILCSLTVIGYLLMTNLFLKTKNNEFTIKIGEETSMEEISYQYPNSVSIGESTTDYHNIFNDKNNIQLICNKLNKHDYIKQPYTINNLPFSFHLYVKFNSTENSFLVSEDGGIYHQVNDVIYKATTKTDYQFFNFYILSSIKGGINLDIGEEEPVTYNYPKTIYYGRSSGTSFRQQTTNAKIINQIWENISKLNFVKQSEEEVIHQVVYSSFYMLLDSNDDDMFFVFVDGSVYHQIGDGFYLATAKVDSLIFYSLLVPKIKNTEKLKIKLDGGKIIEYFYPTEITIRRNNEWVKTSDPEIIQTICNIYENQIFTIDNNADIFNLLSINLLGGINAWILEDNYIYIFLDDCYRSVGSVNFSYFNNLFDHYNQTYNFEFIYPSNVTMKINQSPYKDDSLLLFDEYDTKLIKDIDQIKMIIDNLNQIEYKESFLMHENRNFAYILVFDNYTLSFYKSEFTYFLYGNKYYKITEGSIDFLKQFEK